MATSSSNCGDPAAVLGRHDRAVRRKIISHTDVDRKVRDSIRIATSADSIERSLASLQDTLWPGGTLRPSTEPRSDAEKTETRTRASRKLGLLIPGRRADGILTVTLTVDVRHHG